MNVCIFVVTVVWSIYVGIKSTSTNTSINPPSRKTWPLWASSRMMDVPDGKVHESFKRLCLEYGMAKRDHGNYVCH